MAKIKLNLKDLVEKGDFGKIELGTSKNELLELGLKPENWFSNNSMEDSSCWIYGNFEFYFDSNRRLESIFSDYVTQRLDGGKKIKITDWWLFDKKKISLKQTIVELLKLKLDFEKKYIQPGYIVLSIPKGIHFGFDFTEKSEKDHCKCTMTFIEKRKNGSIYQSQTLI
jgi:hypothetical protein